MKRFALCLAVALLVMLVWPGGGPIQGRAYGSDVFFVLARQVAVVLLLAVALYAAVLFVEHVWTRRRPPSGGGKS